MITHMLFFTGISWAKSLIAGVIGRYGVIGIIAMIAAVVLFLGVKKFASTGKGMLIVGGVLAACLAIASFLPRTGWGSRSSADAGTAATGGKAGRKALTRQQKALLAKRKQDQDQAATEVNQAFGSMMAGAGMGGGDLMLPPMPQSHLVYQSNVGPAPRPVIGGGGRSGGGGHATVSVSGTAPVAAGQAPAIRTPASPAVPKVAPASTANAATPSPANPATAATANASTPASSLNMMQSPAAPPVMMMATGPAGGAPPSPPPAADDGGDDNSGTGQTNSVTVPAVLVTGNGQAGNQQAPAPASQPKASQAAVSPSTSTAPPSPSASPAASPTAPTPASSLAAASSRTNAPGGGSSPAAGPNASSAAGGAAVAQANPAANGAASKAGRPASGALAGNGSGTGNARPKPAPANNGGIPSGAMRQKRGGASPANAGAGIAQGHAPAGKAYNPTLVHRQQRQARAANAMTMQTGMDHHGNPVMPHSGGMTHAGGQQGRPMQAGAGHPGMTPHAMQHGGQASQGIHPGMTGGGMHPAAMGHPAMHPGGMGMPMGGMPHPGMMGGGMHGGGHR